MHSEMHERNREVYQDTDIIREYLEQGDLFRPERCIIELLDKDFGKFSMLDVAVGTGRTTPYFAPLVKSYVGIDYSEKMLEVCRSRFAKCEFSSHVRFEMADMCSLDMFDDDSFDFILISYNAISTLDHEERLATFRELKRVGKHGAYLFFSAHNLRWVPWSLLSLTHQISWLHPRHTYWNLQKWVRAFRHNDWSVLSRLSGLPYAIINDGAHDFRLLHYYIRPEEQIRQLSGDFTDIRVFALDGHEIHVESELAQTRDGFLYYLCNVHKNNTGTTRVEKQPG